MAKSKVLIIIILGILIILGFINIKKIFNNDIIVYSPNLKKQNIKMYWKDKDGKAYSKIENFILKQNNKQIKFVTNGGIYTDQYTPEGLYIENYKVISELNLKSGDGNFYLEPNGVFYIEGGIAKIKSSKDFIYNEKIEYAVQSGPILIKEGQINKKFKKDSKSKKIRSAVGLNKDNKVFFLLSKREMTFYDFSEYALKNLGCIDLLFLDGTISKMYFSKEKSIDHQEYPFVTIITVEDK